MPTAAPPLSTDLDQAANSAAGLQLPTPPAADHHDFDSGNSAALERERNDYIDRQEADEEITPQRLIGAIRDVITDCSDYYQRCTAAYDVRRCLWAGQSSDGRKRSARLGRAAAPWDGASDVRVRVVDEIINENVVRKKAAFFQGDMQAQSHNPRGMAEGQASDGSTLLRYVMRTQMQPEIADEIEFAAQWEETYGSAIMQVSWDRQNRMEPQTVTVQEMADAALGLTVQQAESQGITDAAELQALARESVQETIEALTDPENEDAIIAEILTWATHLTRKQAKAIATELRETGESTYPQPRLAINRPEWIARRPMLDIWFPRATENIKTAAWIAVPEWLTLDELRDKVATEEWDFDFVQAVQEHRGEIFDDSLDGISSLLERGLISSSSGDGDFAGSSERHAEDYQHLYQVVRMYYRATDAKGFPAIHEVVLHSSVPDLVGKQGLLEGASGEMPFVAFRRERQQRAIIDSRGVPELAFTHQQEIKSQRDARTDRSDLTTSPPLKVARNRGGGRYTIGPGMQVPESRGFDTKFMQLPRMDGVTIEIEQSTMDDLDRFFGRVGKNTTDAVTAQLIQQDGVNNFLLGLTTCTRLTWKMMQRYMSETTVTRVIGGQSRALQFTREDIEGEYDFTIAFDVRDLDAEFLFEKLKAISEMALPFDQQGIIDRGELTKIALRAIDSRIADQVTKDPRQAAADEAASEKEALTQMSAGVEPDMVEGQDHQLRLQVLMESVQANPQLAERAQGSDPVFAEMFQNRIQHHQHFLDQRENAQIGRMGAGRVLG